jgi:hypothetical protein
MKARLSQTAGANRTGPPAVNRQRCPPVAASRAVTLSVRDEAISTTSPAGTGR